MVIALALGPMTQLALADRPAANVGYRIAVQVRNADRAFNGEETVRWRNAGKSPLSAVQLHLYLNAYATASSTWFAEARAGRARCYVRTGCGFDPPDGDTSGWLRLSAVRQRCGSAMVAVAGRFIEPDDANANDRTLVGLSLPCAVAAGSWGELQVAFSGRLPLPQQATGCVPAFCFFGQWYPSLAALPGLDGTSFPDVDYTPHQYHAATEFFANFADYDVDISYPSGPSLAVTGQILFHSSSHGLDRLHVHLAGAHDFAFVLGDLSETRFTYRRLDGSPVSVGLFYPPASGLDLERARESAAAGMRALEVHVGPYPFDSLSVVSPPNAAASIGGMEFPTLYTGFMTDRHLDNWLLGGIRIRELDDAHEFSHQYFQGLIATNEQTSAFLDEGVATYFETVALEDRYDTASSLGSVLGRPLNKRLLERLHLLRDDLSFSEPPEKEPSFLLKPGTAYDQIYARPALIFLTAQAIWGSAAMDRYFHQLYRSYAYKHPGLSEYLTAADSVGVPDLKAFLQEAFGTVHQPDFHIVSATTTRASNAQGASPPAPVRGGCTGTGIRYRIVEQGATGSEARTACADAGSQASFPADGSSAGQGAYLSDVRVAGPGWRHLPTTIVFSFAGGAHVTLPWPARKTWREYELSYRAPLRAVLIDPEDRIAVDVDPMNNGMFLAPDAGFAMRWSLFWSAAFQQAFALLGSLL
ncbi:MAG: hypothetical protein WDM91_22500 [Rhizomicrobium sp.]